jgi:hypothetical protein
MNIPRLKLCGMKNRRIRLVWLWVGRCNWKKVRQRVVCRSEIRLDRERSRKFSGA